MKGTWNLADIVAQSIEGITQPSYFLLHEIMLHKLMLHELIFFKFLFIELVFSWLAESS